MERDFAWDIRVWTGQQLDVTNNFVVIQMHMKTQTKSTLIFSMIGFCALCLAQGTKNIKPIPPAELEKADRAAKALDQGAAHMAKGEYDDAIRQFRIAMLAELSYRGRQSSSGAYYLALAYQKKGENENALDAFSKAVFWERKWGDWMVNGPQTILVAMDYAMLAAKVGDHAKAKEMYYLGLRDFNGYGEKVREPIPFLVVFDPEPGMDYWEYSSDNLILAATMAKAPYMNSQCIPMVKEIRASKPDWLVPIVFLATFGSTEESAQFFAAARSMAKTAEERELIEKTKGKERIDMTGANRRKASVVVQDMETRNKRKKEFESKSASPGAPGKN